MRLTLSSWCKLCSAPAAEQAAAQAASMALDLANTVRFYIDKMLKDVHGMKV